APAPRRLRALEAQRMIDLLALRVAPALAAGLITAAHTRSLGAGVIVFVTVLAAAQALDRLKLPLRLMPAAQLLLRFAAPAAGVSAAWLIAAAAPTSGYPIATYEAVLLGAWLVLALGIWFRARLAEGMRARVAVIGPCDFAADLATELSADEPAPYEIVGWLAAGGPVEHGRLRRLGDLDDVRAVVIDDGIELLVCAAEAVGTTHERVDQIWERVADQCLDLPVRMLTANQLYEETFGHVPAGTIDAAWYRYIMHPRFRTSAPASKRIFDLVVGGTIGLLTLPVLAVAAIAIKLTDGGPVLYRQRRFGEGGGAFEIVKLRTMRVDAERAGPQWSGADDGRVTRVGRLLRRTHLDEIPQLWNVLRGEMTLVGPRPERPEIVAELERRFPHYTRRQLVKPGIAGWAQLRCGYAGSELGTAWKLCHDLFYIKHRSVLGDMLILAETAFVTFRNAHRALRSPRERFLLREEPGA
ncbi:MAG TPA: exopolysaccharide biosynthesis polyprenyl glycosylphosphotransferase, partial [Solirubrobacterales bacterium]|nr:exopolysaccharide biosynthesis polyprenyl glycosylphosphotransferase [Solirubrobacterales bacterium]